MAATIDRRVAAVALALALAAASGCGGSPPAAVDLDQARATLTAALESWRGGETIDAMLRRSPAIHVSDHDWRGGARLESYEIKGEGQPSGHRWYCNVLLKLRDAKNKLRTRPASYAVGTSPTPSIIREED